MKKAWLLPALVVWGTLLWAQSSGAPIYSSAGLVNAASYETAALAPNTIATLFGANLAYSIRGLVQADIVEGLLPTSLAGTRVFVGGLAAGLFYVSPSQINFLVPGSLLPGEVSLWVVRDGVRGPQLRITLLETAPALFQAEEIAVASHADGSVITRDSPAHGGETIVLWVTGLGRTDPDLLDREVVTMPLQIRHLDDLRVLFEGTPVSPDQIFYAGLTPGCAGLYQINVRLPDIRDPDPEVRLAIGDRISPSGLRLAASVTKSMSAAFRD